ncbi:MAG: excinuclease ABC subunit UvrA, partial [Chromatiaceae bacterium]|nr:excinuclease ABC subunit UvrA [Chromatiaceae bacterium]
AYSSARACPSCGRAFAEPDPRLFSYNARQGWCPRCLGTGRLLKGFDAEQSGEEAAWSEEGFGTAAPCPECQGARLNPEARAVRFQGRGIAEFSALSVDDARAALDGFALSERERAIGAEPLAEIRARLDFLIEVGLGYLSLDRAAPSLSGGEAQRIRLAAQLGSNLQGVCYVLDEPTIGLHPRDNRRLLDSLHRLEAQGNTILVVEHDEETIRRAEHLIDLGPGAGVHGGRLVAEGRLADLLANPESVTGRALARPRGRAQPARPCPASGDWLRIRGARLHNLHDLDVRLPLGRLVVVTGVSGSGKSSLVREVLGANLARVLGEVRAPSKTKAHWVGCRSLSGWEPLSRLLEVDQSPIGKTPRSCPATYVGIWDAIRRLYAATEEARIQGWGPARFSFNTPGGRCPACEGQGVQRLDMSFLPEARLTCEQCGGSRFDRETRAVRYLGLDIGAVLALSIEEAAAHFAAHPAIARPLELLRDLGLGYLTLGQPSPTLSGGEAQRLKLVTELARARTGRDGLSARPTLYLLDEPSVGLHMADVERLIAVLHRLVEAGHSLVVIEHDLDIIAAADWLIDLGPEGGAAGGRLIAEGPPETLAAQADSATAEALRDYYAGR